MAALGPTGAFSGTVAGPLAIDTYKMLANRYLIHFIDNSAALGALVRAIALPRTTFKIIGDYWLRAASRNVHPLQSSIQSKLNISDDPSRLT